MTGHWPGPTGKDAFKLCLDRQVGLWLGEESIPVKGEEGIPKDKVTLLTVALEARSWARRPDSNMKGFGKASQGCTSLPVLTEAIRP